MNIHDCGACRRVRETKDLCFCIDCHSVACLLGGSNRKVLIRNVKKDIVYCTDSDSSEIRLQIFGNNHAFFSIIFGILEELKGKLVATIFRQPDIHLFTFHQWSVRVRYIPPDDCIVT